MKLNYKNTAKVGLAFAIIMLFWTAYDFVVPLLLDNIYGLPDHIRGIIMGLDNLLSLFLLPLFGKLSDNSKSKWGKRTPFIIMGTVLSVALMVFVPLSSKIQLNESVDYRAEITSSIDSEMLGLFYDDAKAGENEKYCDVEYLTRSGIDREEYITLLYTNIEIEEVGATNNYYKIIDDDRVAINEAEYDELSQLNKKYSTYVESGVKTYVSDMVYKNITLVKPYSLILYMIVLFFVLVCMATFRSPAVALMPDVTPKPLRSQANAIINLAGGLGGAISFLIYTIWFMVADHPYIQIFATMGICMLLLLIAFLKLVNEPKLVEERIMISSEYGLKDEEKSVDITGAKVKMEKGKKISFILILLSIFMWFMGYNAIQSNLSVYATRNLLFEPHVAGIITAISMAFSALAFIPVGFLAVKIGRKKSIIFGFTLATIAFFLNFAFVRADTRIFFALFYLIAGFGLIIANVNTFPMVVELSREEDVGKFTGYYYVATMLAQAVTPFIAGIFMDIKAQYLFLYAAVCVAIALVLMALVKHGDSRMPVPESKLEIFGADED